MLYQGRSGPFSDVRSFLFSGTWEFKSKHSLGAFVSSENESDFLRKARYYAKYAFKVRISTGTFLTAGIMAGVASYQFISTTNANGADNNWDAGAGLTLQSGGLVMSASAFQIPQSVLHPLVGDVMLRRYYTLSGRYKFRLGENFNNIVLAEGRFYQDRPTIARFSTAFEVFDKILAGVQTDLAGNVSVYGGIEWPVSEKTQLQVQGNYILQNLLNKTGYRFNVYEVSIGALF